MSRDWNERKYMCDDILWGIMDELSNVLDRSKDENCTSELYNLYNAGRRDMLSMVCDRIMEMSMPLGEIARNLGIPIKEED